MLAVHDNSQANGALLATDSHGSLVGILSNTGFLQPAYTAHGFSLDACGIPIGFKGEYGDPVTGHYLLGNGYRAFNPVLMRFNSPDTLSPFQVGGINTYAFANGDVINYLDPTGHVKTRVTYGVGNLVANETWLFRTPHKDRPTLGIDAHGEPGFIHIGKGKLNPQQLYNYLKMKKINTDEFSKIMLCSCDSATQSPSESSFAQQFANLTQKPVIGYHERVKALMTAKPIETSNSRWPYEVEHRVFIENPLPPEHKDHDRFTHRPQLFQPSLDVSQVRNGA